MTLPPDSTCDQLNAAREFASEASGYIDTLRVLLTGSDSPNMNEVFRLFHTIKGTAGFSGLRSVETLAHVTETMLDSIRDQASGISARQHNVLETTVETLARMTLDLATVGDTQDAPRALLSELQRLTAHRPVSEKVSYHGLNESAYTAMELTGAAPASADSASLGELLAEAGISAAGSGSEAPVPRPLEELFNITRRNGQHAAKTLNRSVRFDLQGGDISVSGTLDTALATTFLHTTRNAIGHGIESEGERHKLGKPRCGTITIHARLESHQLSVVIRDDGRGLNIEQITTQALRKGLLHREDLERQVDKNNHRDSLADLIFLPGLTTCQHVNSMAGMGVGMDAVKHAVLSAGGSIEVLSTPGVSTEFRLLFAVVN